MYGTAWLFHTYFTLSLAVGTPHATCALLIYVLPSAPSPPRTHHTLRLRTRYIPRTIPRRRHIARCVYVLDSRICCDLRPPSLCSRECNNTIVLNVKINGIQKGYSLNTHKPNQLLTKQIPKIIFTFPRRHPRIKPFTPPRRCGILRTSGIQQQPV